ncbi:7 transmembrane receptor [Dictyocaulus viviparus]|uniref:7 transmembrane receptor n=1 Tax=Dictyocaulus viviparus TaxID=29172 RepID=A0A0D8XNI1_DICVI|nr:7 transmembrane receptor [Dictyocaulus viviparus]
MDSSRAIGSNEEMTQTECARNESYDFWRYSVIVYFGTPIALAGVVCNCILLRLFSHRRSRKSPTLYLLVLAIMDLLMDLLYLPFFTVDALAIYHQNEFLYHIWHVYAIPVFGLSRMVQFASTYMVLCATMERFIVVAEINSIKLLVSEKGRYFTIGIVLACVFVLRLPAFFEYVIAFRPECPIYMSYDYEPLLAGWEHYQIFNFYVMTVLNVFVPFAILLILNISIVALTKRKLHSISWAVTTFIDMPKITELIKKETMMSSKRRRDEVRYATWTMVSITSTYLCCSSLSLFISVMENLFPKNALLFNQDGSSTRFYTLATDVVSILVAVNSLLRLFVYMLCSPTLREDLFKEFPMFTCCQGEKKLGKNDEKSFICRPMMIGPSSTL